MQALQGKAQEEDNGKSGPVAGFNVLETEGFKQIIPPYRDRVSVLVVLTVC